jgi:hypothetical protein
MTSAIAMMDRKRIDAVHLLIVSLRFRSTEQGANPTPGREADGDLDAGEFEIVELDLEAGPSVVDHLEDVVAGGEAGLL